MEDMAMVKPAAQLVFWGGLQLLSHKGLQDGWRHVWVAVAGCVFSTVVITHSHSENMQKPGA